MPTYIHVQGTHTRRLTVGNSAVMLRSLKSTVTLRLLSFGSLGRSGGQGGGASARRGGGARWMSGGGSGTVELNTLKLMNSPG